ncbi:gp436 family protein [Frateuria sp. YIM B11624]|uniref:gp436 family protein n=1 Tax=Frateuria sp. YIM B11624 TaxID=3143185 RepID=UPI003C738A0B
MSYAIQADIDSRYGSNLLLTIADRDGDGVVDTDAVLLALADADDVINSHLAERYQLPLATVPPLLVKAAVDLAVYNLAELPTDEMRNRYNDALKALKNIATGVQQLGLAPPPSTTGQAATFVGPDRKFGRNQVRNW